MNHWICNCSEGKILTFEQSLCRFCKTSRPRFPGHKTVKSNWNIPDSIYERIDELRKEQITWKEISEALDLKRPYLLRYYYLKYLERNANNL